MTEIELVRMAIDMRRLQREYFKTRDRDLLKQCQTIERAFDKAAAEFTNPQSALSL